jgi:hypothetical protein
MSWEKATPMNKMHLLQKLLLLSVPGSVGVGVIIASANTSQPQPKVAEIPTEWKIQTVEIPKIDQKSIHQAFLDRQKQLKDRNFSCDCNGCRVAAAQIGIAIN